MAPCEYSAMITSIACLIAKDKSQEELTLLATTFSQLGDTLATMAAFEVLCCPTEDKDKENKGDKAIVGA